MLILARQENEKIIIRTSDGVITVTVTDIRGEKIRIGIDAPKNVTVDREEIDRLKQKTT